MTTPTAAFAWVLVMLLGTAAFETVALLTNGWTISESWWLWVSRRPWLNVILAAFLVGLLVHLITGETAPRREPKGEEHVRQTDR